jgi:hypothetical protein
MKSHFILAYACLIIMPFAAFPQGTSCAGSIALTLDGVQRAYPASSATGLNVLCTNTGLTPVTWFRFTSNAQGECPLLNIAVSDSAACEVAFYSSCLSLLSSSSMCFYQGYGLWAPNENFVVGSNTTYYLRIKTSTSCTISIAGQHYLPPNDDCFGALSLSNVNISDNNACDHAGPGVLPSQLCALTLENTAWYQFYIASTGYGVINITNIHCDNGATNNSSGFQIGFFQGSCTSLQWLNCTNGTGSTIQATTPLLDAGTRVYVAIDGISGSNCSYQVNGHNIIGVLDGNIKHFSGWKSGRSNILKWTVLDESGGYYVIERSPDGINYNTIGHVSGRSNSNQTETYSFEDHVPYITSFYRLRQFDRLGRQALSNSIHLKKMPESGIEITINNPATDFLELKAVIEKPGKYHCSIINLQGRLVNEFGQQFILGMNRHRIATGDLSQGQYALVITNGSVRSIKMFIKH